MVSGNKQQTILQYSQNVEIDPSNSQRPLSIKRAVYFIMDWEAEFRDKSRAFDREVLWRLTHRVGAIMRKPVNPESVARYRRKYWKCEV